jgi:hypothetical protein
LIGCARLAASKAANACKTEADLELVEAALRLAGLVLGWPLRRFRRRLDRLPQRDPSQLSTLEKTGRLVLGAGVMLLILMALGWLIFK